MGWRRNADTEEVIERDVAEETMEDDRETKEELQSWRENKAYEEVNDVGQKGISTRLIVTEKTTMRVFRVLVRRECSITFLAFVDMNIKIHFILLYLQRVKQLEQQLKGETTTSDGDADTVHTRDHSVSVISNTSFVGEVQSSDGIPDEREKDIRNHFTSRCSHLYMKLTSAVSQASLYQNECESLMKRLVVSEENQTSTEVEVDKQRENVSYLKETLQTTSRNYEEQISTMSEHLADLNERIASQTEYIEQLKYEIKKDWDATNH
ncbi:uncharacterized protein LOC135205171 [Macrobrachium nipponense]|uniref:uncharacterized protein LOC135205171 n=1 Tax=Macrobrachium nipponense TaxID=159736 RepID=UPI0030C8879B